VAGHRIDELVHVEGAEAPPEAQMLFRCHPLVAEEDHAVVEQCLMHIGGGLVVEIARQIDAFDQRAERAADRLRGDRLVSHSHFLPARPSAG
jgi:hypothetical protein